jgi:hypothetical protein
LAGLHTSAAALAGTVSLPERGPAHYLEQVRVARANIEQTGVLVVLSAEHRALLDELRRLLDRVHACWDAICGPCAAVPRTLVHGDLARKNCRLRATPAGLTVVAVDWETAGWGPPAADLSDWARYPRKTPGGWGGTVPLDIYAAAVAFAWPDVTPPQVKQQSRIGSVFRLVAATRWASELLGADSVLVGVAKLAALATTLSSALAAIEWLPDRMRAGARMH